MPKSHQDSGAETMRLGFLVRAHMASLWANIARGIKALAERRDGLLLAAGMLYLVGYLSWAWYGLANGIGFIPVFDAQYFAAGILPAVLICLFLVGLQILRATKTWLKYPPTPRQTQIAGCFGSVSVVGVVLFGVLSLVLGKSKPPWLTWIMITAVASIPLAALFARGLGDKFIQRIMMAASWFYLILGLLLCELYVTQLMSLLPTEWGGARARCVQLDLDSALISPDTRQRLFANTGALPAEGVHRTASIYLIFEGNDYLFLVEHAVDLSGKTNPVFRLRKDAVKAVFPCQL